MSKDLNGKPPVRCVKCKHFIVRPHRDWGKSYTCAKNWYGGCSEPSGYGIRLCAETRDFEKGNYKRCDVVAISANMAVLDAVGHFTDEFLILGLSARLPFKHLLSEVLIKSLIKK